MSRKILLDSNYKILLLFIILISAAKIRSSLSEKDASDLMKKFQPIVFFHKSEKYFPTSIESFKIDWDHVTFNSSSFIIDTNGYKGETSLKQEAPIYVSILENSDDTIRISYLLLFGWNDAGSAIKFKAKISGLETTKTVVAGKYGIDLHYSDVEHIEIFLNGNKTVNYITYAYHQWTKDYKPSEVSWDGTHPIVYSALGSHASYPSSGDVTYLTIWNKSKKIMGKTLYETYLKLVDYCDSSKKWYSTNPRLLKLNGKQVEGISTDEENLGFKYSGRLGVKYENVKWEDLKEDIYLDKFLSLLKKVDNSFYEDINEKLKEIEKLMEANGSKSFYGRSFW